MISIEKNVINTFISEKTCKLYLTRPLYALPDKRLRSLYSNYLRKNKKENFYLTKDTVKRIENMDISKVNPQSLKYLYEKFPKEFSFCFLEKENLSFCYSIDINSIQIIVFKGKELTLGTIENKIKNTVNYSALSKSIRGYAIISFNADELTILENNALSFLGNSNISSDYLNELSTASKDTSYLESLEEDRKIKNQDVFLAIKSFVFLKTASVINKDFISQNNKFAKRDKFGFSNNMNNYTVINSFYDQTINVLNPFAVSGHFRNQPKKNSKGENVIEIIYIDSFMKTGYHRQAGILSTQKTPLID